MDALNNRLHLFNCLGQLTNRANSALGQTQTTQEQHNLDCKSFKQLLDSQTLVDCTLACEGGKISAHKVVLSACSSYLAKILAEHPVEHPIIILPELNIDDVRTLIHYMYTGELLKSLGQQTNSISLLRTAAILSINSLNDLLQVNNFATSQQYAFNSSISPTSAAEAIFSNSASSSSPSSSGSLSSTSSNSSLSSSSSSIADQISPLLAAISQHQQQNHQRHQQQQRQHQQTYYLPAAVAAAATAAAAAAAAASTSTSSPSYDPSLSSGWHANGTLNLSNSFATLTANNSSSSSSCGAASSSSLASLSSGHSSLSSSPQQQQQQLQQPVEVSSNKLQHNKSSSMVVASTNEFQFKCPVCQNNFQTICSFEYHMQRIHNVTSFGCEICHKPFASLRYVLTDHMRRCHGWTKGATNGSSSSSLIQQQSTSSSSTTKT